MPDKETVIANMIDVWSAFDYMGHEAYADHVFKAIQMLRDQTAVVRCKDCKHATVSESGLITCGRIFRTADWYCADGERRGDDAG